MGYFKLPMFESNYTFNKEDALRQEQERIALENERKGLQYNPETGTWTKPVVKIVQPRPNSYWNTVASQYGFKDMQAVKDWQAKNGLVADGKFGKNSLAKWKNAPKNTSESTPTNKKLKPTIEVETPKSQTKPKQQVQNNSNRPTRIQSTISRYTMNNTVGGDFGINRFLRNTASTIGDFLVNMWNTRESSAKPLSIGYGRTTAYQQGGTVQQQPTQEQELQKAFLVYLIQDAAQQGIQSEQDLQAYAEQLGEEGIKAKYQEFIQKMQGGVMARLGAKLEYYKKLKGVCPEGEELVYFKQGGRICKACQKSQNGNKVTKKANEVDKFKAGRAQYRKDMKSAKDEASRDSISINKYSDQEVMANKGHKGNFKNGKWVPDRTKYAKKDACGSKMKVSKCGSKMK